MVRIKTVDSLFLLPLNIPLTLEPDDVTVMRTTTVMVTRIMVEEVRAMLWPM